MNRLKKLRPLIILLLVFFTWMALRLHASIGEATLTNKPILTVNPGEGASAVADKLAAISKANGGSLSAIEISLLATLTGHSNDFKPGDYEIPLKLSLTQTFNKLAKGDIIPTRVRLPEGVTWREIKAVLAKAELEHDAQNLDVAQAAQALNINAESIEGMLFPDTYQYHKGEPETAVLKRAHALLLKTLNTEWETRAANLPYENPYQALIMASIIEKETGTAADRDMVAAVFVNRLKVPMRLQTDPTVIYGMATSENPTCNATRHSTLTYMMASRRHRLPPPAAPLSTPHSTPPTAMYCTLSPVAMARASFQKHCPSTTPPSANTN